MPSNGKVKWIIMLVSIVVALFCGGVGYSYTVIYPTFASNIITNDRASRDRDIVIDTKSITRYEIVKDCMHKNQLEIIKKLTRLETIISER